MTKAELIEDLSSIPDHAIIHLRVVKSQADLQERAGDLLRDIKDSLEDLDEAHREYIESILKSSMSSKLGSVEFMMN